MNIPRTGRSVAGKLLRNVIPLLVLIGGVGAFVGLSSLKKEPDHRNGASKFDRPIVEAEQVREHVDGIDIHVSGIVVPYREIDVPSEVAGRVATKADVCRAGKYVEKGTQLYQIDAQDYELARDEAASALDELRSEIANTQQSLKIAEQQLELERRDYDRNMRLGQAISETELDEARRDLLNAENNLLNLKNQLSLLNSRTSRLETTLRRAELELSRTVIRAPVAGMIVADMVEQDDYVDRGATLLTMEDTSKVEVKCNLRKEDLQWLWLSQQKGAEPIADDPASDYEIPDADADVLFDVAGNMFQWVGRLERYDGIGVDSVTRTIPCRVIVDEPRSGALAQAGDLAFNLRAPVLVRGMYVTVSIRALPGITLWRVPKRAIRPGEKGRRIWLARTEAESAGGSNAAEIVGADPSAPTARLVATNVRVVQTLEDEVIIQSEGDMLTSSDEVVVSPLAYPSDGQSVIIAKGYADEECD